MKAGRRPAPPPTLAAAIGRAVVLLILAAIPALAARFFHPQRPPAERDLAYPPEISVRAARALDEVLWVDAREAADYDAGHIPGAIPLPPGEWEAYFDGFLDEWNPERPVVVYCSSLKCEASKEVGRRLTNELDEGRIYILKGGWEAWLDQ
jgi:rhodanese-related sulfurtransferase